MTLRVHAALAVLSGIVCASSAGCAAGGPSYVEEELELERSEQTLEYGYEGDSELEPDEAGTSGTERCLDRPQAEPFAVDPAAEPTQGRLITRTADGTWVGLPLAHTAFDSVVVGTVAETLVTQRFVNPLDEPTDLAYVFPLPNEAAVDDYWFEIEQRTIRGRIVERKQARELYAKARDEGRAAALLEQERPNVFTQNLANVPAHSEVEVTIHLTQPLRQDDGRFELVFPTVVGPRYGFDGNPPAIDSARKTRNCGSLDVTVSIDAGVPVDDLRSRAHTVHATRDADEVMVELARREDRLDRDFVLSWTTARANTQAVMQLQPEKAGSGYFTLSVYPPVAPPTETPPRELVFVVDTSGSMSGDPLDTAKGAMRRLLDEMQPDDAFQVVRFAGSAASMGDALIPATPEHVEQALDFVDDMNGGGGTEMLTGIRAALELPHRPDRVRMVMFMTDGYIGFEEQVLALIDDQVSDADAHVFALGVGSSVNRYLLDGMARVGHGSAIYVDVGESPESVVERFYEQVRAPSLSNLSVDWGHMRVFQAVPDPLPDLFAGRPLVLFGRYAGAVPSRVTLRGNYGAKEVEIDVPVRVAAKREQTSALASLWARQTIENLEISLLNEPSARRRTRVEREILDLSLEHRVLTDQTAFLAVDDEATQMQVRQGNTIVQTVDGVAGMAWESRTSGLGGDDDDTIDLGNTSTIGRGGGGGTGGGYGRGSGAGFAGRGKRVPEVRYAHAQVSGALAAAIIQRIVRAHINELRGCYNQALVRDSALEGRVKTTFVIAPDGHVSSTVIGESALDVDANACIAHAIRRWKFPVGDESGTTVVNYPFVFAPADAAPTVEAQAVLHNATR